MQKIITGIIGVVIMGAVYFAYTSRTPHDNVQKACTMEAKFCPDGSAVGRSGPDCEFAPCPTAEIPAGIAKADLAQFTTPLERASERVTKKPFGILIDPKTSPVQPEKFSGYHTGTDFETFPDEQLADVLVRTVCTGTLLEKKRATGYGGVLVERCQDKGSDVTVVYGHVALGSVTVAVGNPIKQGDTLGILGAAYSSDTDGERKHLHLGIHRGNTVNILGYVASKAELKEWIDPCLFVCNVKN